MARARNANPLLSALRDGGVMRGAAIETIRSLLDRHDGCITYVAEELGVHYQTAWRAMRLSGLMPYASRLREAAGVSGKRTYVVSPGDAADRVRAR